MQEIFEQYQKTGQLHHFYIFTGDIVRIKMALLDFCRDKLVETENFATSVFVKDYEKLLIEEARQISDRAILKTPHGEKKIFCLSFSAITSQAQNALLKIVEEPTADTHFFFIASHPSIFLPTILSRAIVISENKTASVPNKIANEVAHTDGNSPAADNDLLRILLRKNLGERIKWADDLAKKISDEKIPRSEAQKAVENLILSLSDFNAPNASQSPDASQSTLQKNVSLTVLKKLQKIHQYFGTPNPSIKILLESAVLALPE